MSETNEVAWRLGRYQWLPNCSEERQRWVNTEHDIMFFRIDIGFRPIICYEVDGVEVYEPPNRAGPLGTWYMATKRLIRVVVYNERFDVEVVRREPTPLLRIVNVELLNPVTYYYGITAPFNVEAVKRIVRFAEEVNKMPNHTADLITVNKDGYVLHVRKMERGGRRAIERSLTLNFDVSGKLKMNDVTNKYVLKAMDLPISLWVRGEEA
ncbi:MAG: hypothetical protein L7H00_04765 [Vulcanisaeta sp.]|nr:hypothetical protein [Vulcanisaeta sp.]MCG2892830.1 hypothetical protein [Vulcanisaeta sp.]